MKGPLQIPPHLEGVATLPCEILVYKNRIDRKHSNGRPGVRIVKRMGVKVDETYYCDLLLSRQLLFAIQHVSSDFVF